MKSKDKNENDLSLFDLGHFVAHNVFKILNYLKKNGIYLGIIVALGFGAGYYLDKQQRDKAQSGQTIVENNQLIIKKQSVVVFNYNSISAVREWVDQFLQDDKWKEAGLKEVHIEGVKEGATLHLEKDLLFGEENQSETELISNGFHYYTFEVIAEHKFDFQLFWKELSQKIDKTPYFAKQRDQHHAFLEHRQVEITNSLKKLETLFERETIAPEALIAVINTKKILGEELMNVQREALETETILYEVYEMNITDKFTDDANYNPTKIYLKKIQFPLVGLVLFFLIQWIWVINRKYTKK